MYSQYFYDYVQYYEIDATSDCQMSQDHLVKDGGSADQGWPSLKQPNRVY